MHCCSWPPQRRKRGWPLTAPTAAVTAQEVASATQVVTVAVAVALAAVVVLAVAESGMTLIRVVLPMVAIVGAAVRLLVLLAALALPLPVAALVPTPVASLRVGQVEPALVLLLRRRRRHHCWLNRVLPRDRHMIADRRRRRHDRRRRVVLHPPLRAHHASPVPVRCQVDVPRHPHTVPMAAVAVATAVPPTTRPSVEVPVVGSC